MAEFRTEHGDYLSRKFHFYVHIASEKVKISPRKVIQETLYTLRELRISEFQRKVWLGIILHDEAI